MPAGLELNLSVANLNELHSLDRAERPVLELNALMTKTGLIYAGRSRQSVYGLALMQAPPAWYICSIWKAANHTLHHAQYAAGLR